jgi:hypothetical protein
MPPVFAYASRLGEKEDRPVETQDVLDIKAADMRTGFGFLDGDDLSAMSRQY